MSYDPCPSLPSRCCTPPATPGARTSPRLRLVSSGGATLPAEVIHAFEQRFGCRIREGYGLSETSGVATFAPLDRPPKVGSVGRAVHGVCLEIRDPHGRALPAREVGEVWIKGKILMKGYWNSPDATAEAIRDGWLRTGASTTDPYGNAPLVLPCPVEIRAPPTRACRPIPATRPSTPANCPALRPNDGVGPSLEDRVADVGE